MSVASGKDGKVLIGANAIAEITRWEFNKEDKTTRYASSSTGGFKASVPGVKQGDGTIDFKFNFAAASPIVEGSSVTLLLYLDATHYYTVPAVITKFRVKTDIDEGTVTGATSTFETNGAWTEPTLP